MFFDNDHNYAYKQCDRNRDKSVIYLKCVESNCSAKITLTVDRNNGQTYGGKHRSNCSKSAKQFRQQELVKQKIHAYAIDRDKDALQPLKLYKMCIKEFRNITVTKDFKKQMLQFIRNTRNQQKYKQKGMKCAILKSISSMF